MSDDQIVSCLKSFAEMLADPKGYDVQRLQDLSHDAPHLISSFIQAALDSDEVTMQKKLSELEDHASQINNSQAWFNLGVLAHRFFSIRRPSSTMSAARVLLAFVGRTRKYRKL